MRDFELNHKNEMENVKLKQVEMHEQIKALDNKMEERTVRIEDKIDKFINGCDKKYAPILTWSIMKVAGGVIGGALIMALLSTVIAQ